MMLMMTCRCLSDLPPPPPPENVELLPETSSTLILQWTNPNDTDVDILYYEITWLNCTLNVTFEKTDLYSEEIEGGLDPGTSYDVAIVSVSENAFSENVTVSNSTCKYPGSEKESNV